VGNLLKWLGMVDSATWKFALPIYLNTKCLRKCQL